MAYDFFHRRVTETLSEVILASSISERGKMLDFDPRPDRREGGSLSIDM